MVDNIDHNPSSTTARDSFHGTSISMAQQRSDTGPCQDVPLIEKAVQGRRSILSLPITYTLVSPVEMKNKAAIPPVFGPSRPPVSEELSNKAEQYRWLKTVEEHVCSSEKGDGRVSVSWGAYHASRQDRDHQKEDKIALLPLLTDNAHSPALIKHVMKIVKDDIRYLNPGQTPVIAMDQPLYALAKEIQWCFPEEFGENTFVVMLGGLHIEMAALRLLGEWLNDSGWTSLIESADIVRKGVADSLLKASHVLRTRLAHQTTAAALYILQHRAFQKQNSTDSSCTDFSEWCQQRAKQLPMFCYWSLVLDLELCVLQFIYSIRTSNFELYIDALRMLLPWFFSLDHTHYARWLSVHLKDLSELRVRHPSIFQAFCCGAFTVNKTKRPFSAIALDHAHEQCNATVKGD